MIPFNKIFHTEEELDNIKRAIYRNSISGSGFFTNKCEEFFKKKYNFNSFLTNSCTASLEVISLLANFTPGDEIIMPSYTFVGSATPFVLRGCKPVFVDIRPDTQNIDENEIEKNITSRTKAILVVHYAGVSCEMKIIKNICKKNKLILIEDAAQAINSRYENKFLGTFGDYSAFSFHDTKNITSGEGGLLNINKKSMLNKASIIVEKGTDRKRFLKGEVDKYTWRDKGSSFIQSEINAAFLFAQLKKINFIHKSRKKIWETYHDLFHLLKSNKFLELPIIPKNCYQNYHMFYVKFESNETRDHVIKKLKAKKIQCASHYIPLHSSPAGKRYGRFSGSMKNTIQTSNTILRMPMYIGLKASFQEKIVREVIKSI